jgi:ribosomal-protein-alanine N-acetyltransferase
MPPLLSTKRLILRPPRREDLTFIYLLGSSERVMRYITPGKTQSYEEARDELKNRMRAHKQKLGYWIVQTREHDEFVGWMALKPLEQSKEVEIGFRFLEPHWGRGFATEAGREVLEYAFRALTLPRVAAVVMEENHASRRVLEKLGLRPRARGLYYGLECLYFVIEAAEFEAFRLNAWPR